MMNTGQRVEFVNRRALQMRCRRKKRLTTRLSILSVTLFCCLIYIAWECSGKTPGTVQGMSGATMLFENAGGYVLVGVVCFIAAVTITMLCICEREKNNNRNKLIKEDKET